MGKTIVLLMFLAFFAFFLASPSQAGIIYPSDVPITILDGIDYRNYTTVPTGSWISVINYGKTAGKYILEPGNTTSNLRGNPDSGPPFGYGWVTNYTFQGPIAAGAWVFSRSIISNKADTAFLGSVVYKNCNGVDIRLFSTFGGRNIADGSNIIKIYNYSYSAPYLDVSGCYLRIENWMNVTVPDASSLASLSVIGGPNTWIKFPAVLDVTPPTYSSNSTSSVIAGITITHSLYLKDNMGLSGYIFSFDNGTGTFVNNSFVQLSGKESWVNVTKKVSSIPGATIRWCVYANDTSNNWNGTSCLNPFTYVVIQSPYVAIDKKARESVVKQNQTFTIDIVFHNTGGAIARNVSISDFIPAEVKVLSGDTKWSGQLSPDEGDGITYVATTGKKGYFDLGSASATYTDDAGFNYSVVSPKLQLYIESPIYLPQVSPFSSPSTFFNYLSQYTSELQFIGVIIGISASIYSIYRVVTRTSRPTKYSNVVDDKLSKNNKISELLTVHSKDSLDLLAIRSCRKIIRVLFVKDGLTSREIDSALNRGGRTKSELSGVSDILPVLVKTGLLKETNYRYYLDRKVKERRIIDFLNLLVKKNIDKGRIVLKRKD